MKHAANVIPHLYWCLGARAPPEDHRLYDHATLTPENPPQSHLICHIELAFVRRGRLPAIISTSNRRRAVATPVSMTHEAW